MRLAFVVLLSSSVLVLACGDDGGAAVDAGAVLDGRPDGAIFVSERCDAPNGPVCDPATEICFEGSCAPDACLTEANTCGDDETCDMACVPVADPCEGVDCQDGTTCYQGTCFAGCFPPSPCLGVVCEDGQYCDGGSCFELQACEGACPDDFACNTICRPVSPCIDVVCEDDEVCVNGACRANPCFGVDCADGEICVNGTCIDTCEGCDCQPFEVCVFGECVCQPDCDGKSCGDDDGCGGKCTACPDAEDVCDIQTGSCSCDPSCSGRDCGEPSDCGEPCVTNRGCQGGTCDDSNPDAPVCVCEGVGVEVCDDGDCCNASSDCIDTNGSGQTNRCCTTDRICEEGANQQCCGGSQTCVTDHGCCNTSDVCADTGGNCLCGSGIAINCSNGSVGDEFCCANAARACEQDGAAVACCPSGFTCFDSTDAGSEHDTCCTESSWCGDKQTCCDVAAGEVCYDDDDDDPDNDTCCAPSCDGKSCGDDDGCGGRCVTQTCGAGQSCVVIGGPDNVACQDNDCDPACNPCTEVCVAGSCEPRCTDGQTVDPTTCQCSGPVVD